MTQPTFTPDSVFVQLVEGIAVPLDISQYTTLVASYTFATLPTPGKTGKLAYVTDIGGGALYRDDPTATPAAWKPAGAPFNSSGGGRRIVSAQMTTSFFQGTPANWTDVPGLSIVVPRQSLQYNVSLKGVMIVTTAATGAVDAMMEWQVRIIDSGGDKQWAGLDIFQPLPGLNSKTITFPFEINADIPADDPPRTYKAQMRMVPSGTTPTSMGAQAGVGTATGLLGNNTVGVTSNPWSLRANTVSVNPLGA